MSVHFANVIPSIAPPNTESKQNNMDYYMSTIRLPSSDIFSAWYHLTPKEIILFMTFITCFLPIIDSMDSILLAICISWLQSKNCTLCQDQIRIFWGCKISFLCVWIKLKRQFNQWRRGSFCVENASASFLKSIHWLVPRAYNSASARQWRVDKYRAFTSYGNL